MCLVVLTAADVVNVERNRGIRDRKNSTLAVSEKTTTNSLSTPMLMARCIDFHPRIDIKHV